MSQVQTDNVECKWIAVDWYANKINNMLTSTARFAYADFAMSNRNTIYNRQWIDNACKISPKFC